MFLNWFVAVNCKDEKNRLTDVGAASVGTGYRHD